jgi:hypothetical protein
VADRYRVNYILLEAAHVEDLHDLYLEPEDTPGFKLMGTIDDSYIIRLGCGCR